MRSAPAGNGWSQILFERVLPKNARPEIYLFAVTTQRTGYIDAHSAAWKADSVQVVALSEHDDQQEAMLLMPAHSWVRGELGTFYAEPSAKQFWSAGLRLERAGLAG
jgi:hypothetical protein